MGIIPHFPGRERGFSPEQEKPYSREAAYKKAEDVLRRDAIRMEDFNDLYGAESVAKDAADVQRLKQKFEARNTPEEKSAHQLAVILEAVVHDQINKNQWFGPRARSIRATDFDDVIGGVDNIVEFKEPRMATSYAALGIDVTYRKDVHKKFARIKEEIDKGKLATIKYLKSSDGLFRGERNQVPRLVVDVEGQTSEALAKAWFRDAPGLKANPVRFQIVHEIQSQLAVFEAYARKVGQNAVADEYGKLKTIVDHLVPEVDKQFANRKYEITDASTQEIENELLGFK